MGNVHVRRKNNINTTYTMLHCYITLRPGCRWLLQFYRNASLAADVFQLYIGASILNYWFLFSSVGILISRLISSLFWAPYFPVTSREKKKIITILKVEIRLRIQTWIVLKFFHKFDGTFIYSDCLITKNNNNSKNNFSSFNNFNDLLNRRFSNPINVFL
jgi:hypothetical protein